MWNCQLLLPGWMLGQGGVGKGVVLELLPFLSYQVDASRFLGQADIIIERRYRCMCVCIYIYVCVNETKQTNS